MEEVLLFCVRAFVARFFGDEISRQCVSGVNTLRFDSSFCSAQLLRKVALRRRQRQIALAAVVNAVWA
jgi:hypothetical protein